jgi:hypothetical protein
MLPREHGAYGQLLFPLVTALALTRFQGAALLTALAAVAAFVAHEPLLVLSGGRGARARRENQRRAVIWLVTASAIAIAAGLFGYAATPAGDRLIFLSPLLLAGVLIVLLLREREKSTAGEIIAAIALSSAAIPVCASVGSPHRGLVIAVIFGGLFVVSTLAVRIVILAVRGGGNPEAVRRTRLQLATAAMLLVTTAVLLATRSALPPLTAAVTIVPGLALATAMAVRPPPASRLRTIGWTLVATSAFTAAVLIVTLAGPA